MLFEQLAQRPVGDPVAVREAPARTSHGHRLLLGEDLPQLAYEPRLPDSRLADDRDEVRLGVGRSSPVGRPKQLELALTTDEDAAEASQPPRAHQSKSAKDGPTRNSSGLALRLHGAQVAELERTTRGHDGSLTGEDLLRLRRFLKPIADIDGVPGNERAAQTRLANHGLAGVHADAQLELTGEQLVESPLHRERCVKSPLRMILERHGRSEDRHDRVARELLDRAARSLDLLRHRVIEALETDPYPLGILVAGKRGRADEVGEENRDELSLLPYGHGRSLVERSALG